MKKVVVSSSQSIRNASKIELRAQGIPFFAQKPLALTYKGVPLQSIYQPDFICYDSIVLEIKAVKELVDEHRAQVLNYPKAEVERIVAEKGRYMNQTANYTNPVKI